MLALGSGNLWLKSIWSGITEMWLGRIKESATVWFAIMTAELHQLVWLTSSAFLVLVTHAIFENLVAESVSRKRAELTLPLSIAYVKRHNEKTLGMSYWLYFILKSARGSWGTRNRWLIGFAFFKLGATLHFLLDLKISGSKHDHVWLQNISYFVLLRSTWIA